MDYGKKMKEAKLPKDHWEDNYSNIEVAGGKYASEFGAEEELRKSENKLANYVKKNRAQR